MNSARPHFTGTACYQRPAADKHIDNKRVPHTPLIQLTVCNLHTCTRACVHTQKHKPLFKVSISSLGYIHRRILLVFKKKAVFLFCFSSGRLKCACLNLAGFVVLCMCLLVWSLNFLLSPFAQHLFAHSSCLIATLSWLEFSASALFSLFTFHKCPSSPLASPPMLWLRSLCRPLPAFQKSDCLLEDFWESHIHLTIRHLPMATAGTCSVCGHLASETEKCGAQHDLLLLKETNQRGGGCNLLLMYIFLNYFFTFVI